MNNMLNNNTDILNLNNTFWFYSEINFGKLLIEQLNLNSKSIIEIEKKRKIRIFEDILRISVYLDYKNLIINTKFNNLKFDTIIDEIIDLNKQVYQNIGLNSFIMLSHLLNDNYNKYNLIFSNLTSFGILNTQNELSLYSEFMSSKITNYFYLQKLLLKEEYLLKSILVTNNHYKIKNINIEHLYN